MSIEELVGKIPTKTKHRYFKTGDVLQWCPMYASQKEVERRGLAIVISHNGPKFEAYWVGSKEITSIDARLGAYILQDIAPIPEVAEALKKMKEVE
jgi:hypothetical protein